LSFSLFHGGSFSLTGNPQNEDATIKRISSLASVKSVTPVRELHLPPRQVSTAHDTSFQRHHANILSRRGQSFAVGKNDFPHVMTGVDRLRDEGYLGSGLRVAVVDTGIDYKHPALGGCFGEGCLVSFGWNLVDNTTDPYDNCDGHGTHVSGLIAAQSNAYNFTGVAPNVTLGHYKVNKCKQGSSTDQIMQAFRMAFEDKADIITASIGSYSGWSEEPWGVLISRIVKAGVPCMVAVGNDGAYGMFYASDGADGKGATGVGSVNNVMAPMLLNKATYSTKNGTNEFGWSLSGTADFKNGTYQLYPLSLNSSIVGDGCEALPSSTPDLSKKIVLIRRGGCAFSLKAANAANAGAKNILFYNDIPGVDQFSFTNDKLVGIGMVPASTGENWVKLAAKNTIITLRMTSKAHSSSLFISEKNKVAGGYVSDFSQWGPINELVALPTISAPGGFMLSTYPLALGGYAVESGTSMATPYFAGCIALLFEARGKISSSTVQSLFATNSNPNVFHDGVSAYPWLDSVAQQGAGLINAYDAVHAKTVLNVSSISFNDTEHLTPTSFSLKNTGSQDVTYTIDQVGSGTVYTLANDGTTIPVFFDAGDFMETTTTYASLSFSSKRVVVSPGQTAVVRVSAAPPKGLNASRIPIYSGYVTLNGTNGDSLSIPYLGAATSMRNVTILDTKHGDNVLKSSVSSKPVTAGQVFTFAGPHGAETNTSYPVFDLLLSMGTRLLEIDAKSSNGTVLGSIAQFPQEFKSRSATGVSGVEWQGYMADGSNVPAGSYSLRVRALKIFGNPAKNSDYDVVETPWFKVRYVEGGLTPHRL
jgi:subtilisin family serine protease